MINACDDLVHIPMQNGVESLNVSIAASLVAFRSMYRE
jgi:tRNA G18 (ribose-2'-O)-methylase SpoU